MFICRSWCKDLRLQPRLRFCGCTGLPYLRHRDSLQLHLLLKGERAPNTL
jgi:hypothetical protein